jgi:hypothetical protein
MPLDRLENSCNFKNVPAFEAIASQGLGVFATLKSVSKEVLNRLE